MDRAYPAGPLPDSYRAFFEGPFRAFCVEMFGHPAPIPRTYAAARRLVEEVWRLNGSRSRGEFVFARVSASLRTSVREGERLRQEARETIEGFLNLDFRPTRFDRICAEGPSKRASRR